MIREEKAWVGTIFYNGWRGEWGIRCLSFIDDEDEKPCMIGILLLVYSYSFLN